MFDKFRDYMYYLLHEPIRNRKVYILFNVIGKIFDQIKEDIFEIRKQSNILTATGKYLDVHGRERNMNRLRDEEDDNYRQRLLMKKEIAEKAGTLSGIKLVLESLGYRSADENIIPNYLENDKEWAEFTLYLENTTGSVTDLDTLSNEIRQVKQASSKPNYGMVPNSDIVITSKFDLIKVEMPICNVLICGTYPKVKEAIK